MQDRIGWGLAEDQFGVGFHGLRGVLVTEADADLETSWPGIQQNFPCQISNKNFPLHHP